MNENSDTSSGLSRRTFATLRAFTLITGFLFLTELAIMFLLDVLGISQRFSSGYIMNNLLDATTLVVTSAPFIWWILRQHGRALDGKESAELSLFLHQKAFENASEAFMLTDRFANIVSINPAFTAVTGYTREEVIGRNPRILQSGHHEQKFYEEMWATILKEGQWQGEIWNRRKNGEIYPEWLTISSIRDGNKRVTHFISVFTDITLRKRMEENLHQMTNFDALTGLPNREMLYDRLESAFERARQGNTKLGLIFFDLDRFKHVNETFGHKIGDELLRVVAERLLACMHAGDTVCRLGGDEFIILLESIQEIEEIAEIAQKILAGIAQSFKIQGYEMHTTASLGICIYPDDGADRTTLMKNADTALYRAIENGGNSYQFYMAEMNASALERLTLENALRYAVERNELRLYYQPQVETKTGRIIGVEALIRWCHPEFGLISPGMFIPMAEQNGMIIEIGDWVLRTACKQAREWKDAGHTLRVGVNMSPRQFHQADVHKKILNVLHETGLDPHQLEIEITESMVMSNPDEAIAVLKGLQALGVLVAIDDFGTGHSSLALLKNFPINTLKIDQSFVKDIANNTDDAAITAAIVSLAHRLDMKAIAEGVETMDQLEFMLTHDCHEIQGYLFSRPLPKEDLEKLLLDGVPLAPGLHEAADRVVG
jgi:diguanylate cyclase (GGDEF)-like protein/PAS domain S-box-containing protein